MTKIAVCDDNCAYLNMATNRIRSMYVRHSKAISISSYLNAQELLQAHEIEKYDIIFTDVSMPEMDGFELARRVEKATPSTLLVFFTDYSQLVFESFEHHPIWFIRKTNFDEDLARAYDELERRRAYEEGFIEISYRDKDSDYHKMKVHPSQLSHIESEGHTLTFHFGGRTQRATGSLGDWERKLADMGFVRVHSGFLVNARFIFSIEKNYIELESGEEIPMSRYRTKQVESYIAKFGGK